MTRDARPPSKAPRHPSRADDDPTASLRASNRPAWDERVRLHLADESYGLDALRAGRGRLYPIEETEFDAGPGLRILHLQCHFGRDTLTLAPRGAEVVGLDFSPEGVAVAERLSAELGLADRARFVCADLYAAREAGLAPASFDRVFVTWGALCWLPDLPRWAAIVRHFLKPGGALYLAEFHPASMVFDIETERDDDAPPETRPRPFSPRFPYFDDAPFVEHAPRDYVGDRPVLESGVSVEWTHTLGDVVSAVVGAGLALRWLREHDATPWSPLPWLVLGEDQLWRWPGERWLPLSFSLWAERTPD